MGYQRTKGSYVYVVTWDDARFIKIGSSGAQRWRSFLIRGARLVWLGKEGRMDDDIPGELAYQMAAQRFARYAFDDRAEATPFLGSRGGGWTECYRLDGLTAESFWNRCVDAMPEHYARASDVSMATSS